MWGNLKFMGFSPSLFFRIPKCNYCEAAIMNVLCGCSFLLRITGNAGNLVSPGACLTWNGQWDMKNTTYAFPQKGKNSETCLNISSLQFVFRYIVLFLAYEPTILNWSKHWKWGNKFFNLRIRIICVVRYTLESSSSFNSTVNNNFVTSTIPIQNIG